MNEARSSAAYVRRSEKFVLVLGGVAVGGDSSLLSGVIWGPLADGFVKKPWDSQPRLKTPLILSDFRDAACDSPRFFHIP